MRLRKMFKNKLAFTLVELVIAIAVMAILAGAVAGAVVGVRASAQKSAVTTPANSLASALKAYATTDIKNTTDQNTLMAWIKNEFPDKKVDVKSAPASITANSKPSGNGSWTLSGTKWSYSGTATTVDAEGEANNTTATEILIYVPAKPTGTGTTGYKDYATNLTFYVCSSRYYCQVDFNFKTGVATVKDAVSY